jgi:hypothetical protein
MPSQFDVPSQLEHVLRSGSVAIADTTMPRSVASIRARGDQRRRHQVIGAAVAAVAIAVAGGVTITQLWNPSAMRAPAPMVSQHGRHHGHPAIGVLTMPDAVGLPESAAVFVVTSAGFHVVTEVVLCDSAAVPAGTVCRTEPAAGSRLPAGTTVVIDVAVQRGH